jgi:hypothetical protein
MTFDHTFFDFGKMKKGEQRTHVFPFKNTGDEVLVIELVSGCECTTLEWPEYKKFEPGESGEIKATFDSTTEEGDVTKTIDILLEHVDPKTGYQILLDLKYRAIVYE